MDTTVIVSGILSDDALSEGTPNVLLIDGTEYLAYPFAERQEAADYANTTPSVVYAYKSMGAERWLEKFTDGDEFVMLVVVENPSYDQMPDRIDLQSYGEDTN